MATCGLIVENGRHQLRHSIKQSLDKFIARESMVRGNHCKDSSERTHPERVVIRDSDMVRTMCGASQP